MSIPHRRNPILSGILHPRMLMAIIVYIIGFIIVEFNFLQFYYGFSIEMIGVGLMFLHSYMIGRSAKKRLREFEEELRRRDTFH
jgi:hypothetical protein